ncbi:spore maturation protein CgeB [Lachnospiraceae bacterium C7]|nr:spore maturation protein CgeB [Lachnospiraceae bacterium C7]
MKFLFYRYGSICEEDLIETFKEYGYEIVEYTKEIYNKNYSLKLAVKEVGNVMMKEQFDFVFSINFYPFLSELCKVFKIRYISWIVDSPVMELYSSSITNSWNRTFIFDRALYNEIKPLNPDCVFYLPLGARLKNKDAIIENASREDKDKFTHDISFVGSLYTEKNPYTQKKEMSGFLDGYLEAIIRSQEWVYGYYFVEKLLEEKYVDEIKENIDDFLELPGNNFLTDKRTLSQFYLGSEITARERVDTVEKISNRFSFDIYTGSDTTKLPKVKNHGYAKTLTEMPLIFNNTKINLNMTSKMIRTGLPLRIFDIMSCKGFVLSNYQEEIFEEFENGEEIVTYSSPEEMVYLIEYYLQNDKRRKEIAENGYMKVKNEYTYEKRIEKMLIKSFEK